MMGATLVMAKDLIAVDRIRLSSRLRIELQKETPNYTLLKLINAVLRQELEPFDFRHKLVLSEQLDEIGIIADEESAAILNEIPDFMQDAIERELEMLKNADEV
jgi:argininosuccinate lyase